MKWKNNFDKIFWERIFMLCSCHNVACFTLCCSSSVFFFDVACDMVEMGTKNMRNETNVWNVHTEDNFRKLVISHSRLGPIIISLILCISWINMRRRKFQLKRLVFLVSHWPWLWNSSKLFMLLFFLAVFMKKMGKWTGMKQTATEAAAVGKKEEFELGRILVWRTVFCRVDGGTRCDGMGRLTQNLQ